MANPMTSIAVRTVFDEAVAAAMNPTCLERFRLDRLLELRAVIDSIRDERGQELLRDVRAERDRHRHC